MGKIVIPSKKDKIIKNLETDQALMLFDSMNDKAKIFNLELEVSVLSEEISKMKERLK